jgi:hypothetical protein
MQPTALAHECWVGFDEVCYLLLRFVLNNGIHGKVSDPSEACKIDCSLFIACFTLCVQLSYGVMPYLIAACSASCVFV